MSTALRRSPGGAELPNRIPRAGTLRRQHSHLLGEDAELNSVNFPDFITYVSDGTSNISGNFVMCDDRGDDHALALCVSPTGRVNVSDSNCAGGDIVCL